MSEPQAPRPRQAKGSVPLPASFGKAPPPAPKGAKAKRKRPGQGPTAAPAASPPAKGAKPRPSEGGERQARRRQAAARSEAFAQGTQAPVGLAGLLAEPAPAVGRAKAPRLPRVKLSPEAHRCGLVAIVGRPNVGKSTLLNRLVGQKVAITSNRPQTTRHALKGIVSRPEGQLIFVDTPGIHKPHHELGQALVEAAGQALAEVDARLFVVNGQEAPGPGDRFIAELLARHPKPTLLVVNQVDRVARVSDEIFQAYRALYPFVGVVPCSARTGRNTRGLVEQLLGLMPEGPALYDPELPTDQSLRQLAAEHIREALMRQMSDELPHSVAVLVEAYDESQSPPLVQASIFVERESQKGIVIGAGASRLKEVGIAARQAMEADLDGPVHLELHVKVWPNWRKDRRALKELGYLTT